MNTPIVVIQRFQPTCGRADCLPEEQPEHWVDVELTQPVLDAIAQAKVALVGDSNDAEYDALYSLVTALGYEVPDCDCTLEDYPHHDQTCPAKAWEAKTEDRIPVQDPNGPDAVSAREYRRST